MPDRLAVVIPVYNHAAYIGEALESVLSQSRRPDRVLVIDDGSKDDSLAVMEPFRARGVEIHGRENRGAHNTINELIERASEDCQWISILNSDDRYLPQRFETCLATAAANPGKSVISTRLEVIDAEGQRMAEDEPRARWFYGVQSLADAQPDLSPAEWLGRGNFIATTSNVFARADYLRANPFRPYRFNHDYFFLAGAAWRDQIALDPGVHMQYRVHGSNTISTHPEPLIREMLRMHLDLLRHYAAELRADPELRVRFYDYMRALWDNISSCHAGMLHVMVAQLLQNVSESDIETLAQSVNGPEFEISPNRALAGGYDGTEPLSLATLGKKVEQLRAEKQRIQEDRDASRELLRLKGDLLRSRWISLGSLLGRVKAPRRNIGKTPAEKLAHFRSDCQKDGWLKLGSSLGSKTCRDLRTGK
ncbi:MAG: glycosyltransferase family 2 protein [Verrucomicrobiales bacterium]|nr:glycosyltransferase family 2 protein [Verrucomicrobiales bacterium]